MKIRQLLGAGAVLSLVVGCGVMPYQPAPNEVLVPIKYVGSGQPLMCKEGKTYSLTPVGNTNVVQVPVGGRVGLGASLRSDGYNVIHTCHPWLGFVPEANRSYVANAGLFSTGRCFVELVREDTSKDTGVSVEPSVGPPGCVAPASPAASSAPR